MDANARNADDLFNGKSQYLIPVFQRPYVWEQRRQWEPLWADVEDLANAIFEAPDTSDAQHFLGAIVLQNKSLVPGDSVPWFVIDGQQRLLTLQLLLDASKMEYSSRGAKLTRDAQRLRRLVQNNEEEVDPNNPDTAFKVWPTFSDQDAFRAAMSDTSTTSYQESRVVRAHDFFRQQVRGWLARDPENVVSRAEALSKALRERLMVVAIGLDGRDNPNLIFETLNARGTPLLAWDLIKNYLLFEEQRSGGSPEVLHSTYLRPLEHDSWWSANVQKGTQDIDLFLYHWLVMRSQSKVLARDIYQDFRRYAAGRTAAAIAKDIHESAEKYRSIFTTADDTAVSEHLVRWRSLDIGVSTPIVLWLLTHHVNDHVLTRSLHALESFFVRRMVCGIGVAGLNSWFPRLIEQLENAKTDADETLIGLLAGGTTHTRRWPDDAEFSKALFFEPAYEKLSGPRLRTILLALEYQMGAGYGAATPKPNLTIEHIMPQHWEKHYPLSDAMASDDETPRQHRERLIHTVGNLTLSQAGLGAKMGDGPWSEKSELLEQFGMLLLTKDALDHVSDGWTDEDIESRSRRLADIALEIWPPPDKI